MLKLYYFTGSIARSVFIALHEVGAEFESQALNPKNGDQRSPDYLAINPKGRVPALVTEHGILTENAAILEYIARRFPQAQLAPLDDAWALAQLQAFNGYLASTLHVNHAHRLRGPRWADLQSSYDDMYQKVPQTMGESMQYIEDNYLSGDWVMGDQFTIADAYFHAVCYWLTMDEIDIQAYPKAAAHFARMSARESVQKTLAMGG